MCALYCSSNIRLLCLSESKKLLEFESRGLKRFEQNIEAHHVETEEIIPPVQKPQACCACPEIILEHIKLII